MVLVRTQSSVTTSDFATRRFLWGPVQEWQLQGQSAADTTALSDADNSVASTTMISKDGAIDRVGVNISAKTGADATVKYFVGLVTLDASGNPTTTAYGGSAPANPTQVDLVTGFQWLTLATPATGAAGDLVAVRIWPDSGSTAPTAAFVAVRRAFRIGNLGSALGLPHATEFATAWTKSGAMPILPYRYSDGTLGPLPAISASAIATSSFKPSTTPDEVGAKLQVPWGAVCRGARVQLDVVLIATSALTIKLYSAADALLASATIPAATLASASLSTIDVYWDAVTLDANTDYRLTVLPTADDNTQLAAIVAPDTDSKEALACGDKWGLTTRTDEGAWTDTPNTVPLVGLWLAGAAS